MCLAPPVGWRLFSYPPLHPELAHQLLLLVRQLRQLAPVVSGGRRFRPNGMAHIANVADVADVANVTNVADVASPDLNRGRGGAAKPLKGVNEYYAACFMPRTPQTMNEHAHPSHGRQPRSGLLAVRPVAVTDKGLLVEELPVSDNRAT